MNLEYQYYRTDCVLRTLYIGGCPLDGGTRCAEIRASYPRAGRGKRGAREARGAGSAGRAPRCGERAAVRRKLIAFGAN